MRHTINIDSKDRSSGDEFNFRYDLRQQLKRVKTIELVTCELPCTWTTVRSGYNTFSYGSTTVTVPDGNYSISDLLLVLNELTGLTFTVSETSGKVTLTSSLQSVTVNSTTLSTLLGFTDGQSGTVITATNCYILDFDLYVSLWIKNVPSHFLAGQPCTFKLPVGVSNGYVFYYVKNAGYELISDVNGTLSYLEIQVLDRYNNVLSNNGVNWSMTLQVKCD